MSVKNSPIFAFAAMLVAIAPAQAAQWSVDYTRSKLEFTANWSNEPFTGAFKSWKADIVFDPSDLAHARADVAVALSSEVSDEPDFDDGLKGAQGFQVSQFPTAHFVATHFEHVSGDNYVATGKLSLRGVTENVTLPFALTIEGTQAHMKGKARLMRTDFGVGQGQWSAPSPVAREVAVTVDLFAKRM